jgi:glutamate/tyrosine decarboxylase-like PLP-dependent enzyme
VNEARDLLRHTAELAAQYLESLGERPVFPRVTPEELREALGGPLPEDPVEPERVMRDLVAAAEPGVVAEGSGRYFGFVIGGSLPAALAADWLTSTWDQNAGLYSCGPSASVVEEVTREWIVELLGLPADASIGFVTGTQMAHV